MAQTRALTANPKRDILALRVGIIFSVLAAWEIVARSGLLFQDVVPPLFSIGRAFAALILGTEFYLNLQWTLFEVVTALFFGGVLGLATGLVLGANRFLARAYEPYLYYLGSTPKMIFFPVMIMLFGVGAGSKIALGFISCFFPIALSTAAGVRQINPVLIRVGKSFRAPVWRMVRDIYLPAMRAPVLNGCRLGLGIAIIATLLAETKLSNRGVGYLVIQAFSTFDMPKMYALLIAVFALAIAANALLSRAAAGRAGAQRVLYGGDGRRCRWRDHLWRGDSAAASRDALHRFA